MKAIIIILIAMISNLSYANLYQCKSPDADPKLNPDNNKQAYPVEAPNATYIAPYAKHPDAIKALKKPFLIYYAIDTEEPFMQYSIQFELAELRRACERSEHVNYIAFLNSDVVWGKYIYCKDKKFVKADISEFPELKEKLESKRRAIWEGDQSNNLTSPLRFVSRYNDDVKKVFYEYPLAHPDFVHDLMEFAVKTEKLFPQKDYTAFINFKSHGNTKTMLAGLQKCQIEAKKLSQQAVLDKLSEGERMLLKNSSAFYHFPNQMKAILDKLALGEAVAAKPALGDYSLGDYSLGDYSLGDYSLGDEGLGAKFSFGTTQAGISTVLNRLFNEKDESLVGFVMLESCDTNRKVSVHQEHVPMVLGMYSAEHSLWYRNLNWWTMMEEARGNTEVLFDQVTAAAKNIRNIVVK